MASGSYEVCMAGRASSEPCQRNKREVKCLNFSGVVVLYGVCFAWPGFLPIRPEHTPQPWRSHATPPSQNPRQASSTEWAPGRPDAQTRVQPDVPRNSGEIVSNGFYDQFWDTSSRGGALENSMRNSPIVHTAFNINRECGKIGRD